MEMIAGKYLSFYGKNNFGYSIVTTVEESLELSGTLLLLYTLSKYVKEELRGIFISIFNPRQVCRCALTVQLSSRENRFTDRRILCFLRKGINAEGDHHCDQQGFKDIFFHVDIIFSDYLLLIKTSY